MATIIQKTTNNISTEINGNKKANTITNDENNKTIKQPQNNKGRCKNK
jgi:hypothetical protein